MLLDPIRWLLNYEVYGRFDKLDGERLTLSRALAKNIFPPSMRRRLTDIRAQELRPSSPTEQVVGVLDSLVGPVEPF
jgi:hypothetical protein